MKFKSFLFVLCIVCLCLSSLPAFAVDESSGADAGAAVPSTVDELINNPDYTIESVQLFSALSPVDSAETSGLKSVLLDVLGPYDGIVVEYEYRNPNASYNNYLREVQPDYVWIASFILLALVVYCLFRLGGALLG